MYATHNGFDIEGTFLCGVVKNDPIRMVVVAGVRRFEMSLVAICVVALAVLTATVNMLCVVCVAR